MRPSKENLLPCLGADGLWHYANAPVRYRVLEAHGHLYLALCGKEAAYAGDGHVATCLRCVRDWCTW